MPLGAAWVPPGAAGLRTVRALAPVALWSLEKASFEELLLRQLHLREVLSAASEQRAAICRRLAGVRGG